MIVGGSLRDIKEEMLRVWDLEKAPTPAYIIHEEMLRANLETISRLRREAQVEVVVALKANATWPIFGLLAEHSDGATASSLAEARLVAEQMGVKAHTYAPVYTDEEFDAILEHSSHLTFNSLGQWQRFGERALRRGVSCGLRVNPEYSTVKTDLYNPAMPTSRLGVRSVDIAKWPEGIEGLHFHALCESRPEDFEATLRCFEERFGQYFERLSWVNFGGGHLVTHADYDLDRLIALLADFRRRHPHLRVILEPGSAFTWDTGVLVARVEDVVYSGGRRTLMLNVSFACHMPDCLEMPYKPTILNMHEPRPEEEHYWMGGNSCLAGDTLGGWATDDGHSPEVGERIVFRDMIHYTMVKTTMFNGVSHPSIVLYSPERGFQTLRKFDYTDYKQRMG